MFYWVKINDYSNLAIGGIFKNLTTDDVKNISIQFPSLEIQQEILAKLNKETNYIKQTEEFIENQKEKNKLILSSIYKKDL